MAKATTDGGKGNNKIPMRPGSPGTKMVKQEVPIGNIGKAVVGVAAKTISAIKLAQKAKTLTPEEKFALKYVKQVAKNGKPGDVQKTLDKLPSQAKLDISNAIKKVRPANSASSRAPKVSPDATKVRNPRTGKTVTVNNK